MANRMTLHLWFLVDQAMIHSKIIEVILTKGIPDSMAEAMAVAGVEVFGQLTTD